MLKRLFARKPMRGEFVELDDERHGLRRHLKAIHLISIGIGAIIGAGIFVITGQAAAEYAGPAVVLSFIVASFICIFAGLCYAELSSLIPISGGSYSYSYVSMGEFPAWIVGWVVTAQYLASASTVAVGWSGYFMSILKDFGLYLPSDFAQAPFAYDAATGLGWSGAILNIPAMFLVALVCLLISIGIKAAAHFTNAMVAIKLSTILLFICIGLFHINPANWTPFIPDNTGVFGEFGWSGILRGAGLVFFAYVGFDTVSTLAQDAVNPQKDLPRGILGSLGICTIAYIITALILTGVVSYTLLGVPDPMAIALNAMGPQFFWIGFIVKIAILAGLSSVVLVQLLGQTRVFLAISKDGLLPHRFAKLHSTLRTPVFSSTITGITSMLIAGFFPVDILGSLVSMTTLFLFTIVCLGVWILRHTHPEFNRPFKVPLVPYIPLIGIIICIAQMCFLPLITWLQLALWLLLGLAIYFGYGVRNSKISKCK
ncbi:MAG: amino acid permease [Chlamydiae bacterium RIFCSPHIGHO2_12_FULL_49_9]|nr:MAG: amino acid permease [Chlamydiae bacterium RIFCSPHIGHO2_12_FULL_49_9]